MFKLLGRADTWLEVGLRWGTGFGFAWAGFTWLAKKMTQFGTLNWADAVAVGLGGAMVLSVVASLALIAIRYFRPLGPQAQGVGAITVDRPVQDDRLKPRLTLLDGQVEGLRDRIESMFVQLAQIGEDRKAIISDYQNMRGLEARIGARLEGVETGLVELAGKTGKTEATLFLALQAIKARETERFYAEIIEEEGAHLQRKVLENEPFQGEDWAAWEGHAQKLGGAMYKWLELADGWHPSVRTWINDIPPERLTSLDWGDIDRLFQNANQVITYKTTITRLGNWQHARTQIVTAIHMAAFGGPSAGALLEQIPGGGPTVEGVKATNQ